MPRAVRFEDYELRSPEELASPHHCHIRNLPKGILREPGTFEKIVSKPERRYSKITSEKRSRRHSTPVKIIRQMQNLAIPETPISYYQEPDQRRSRRRSMPSTNSQSQPLWLPSPLGLLKDIRPRQLAVTTRGPLSSLTQPPFDEPNVNARYSVFGDDSPARFYGTDSQPGYINPGTPWPSMIPGSDEPQLLAVPTLRQPAPRSKSSSSRSEQKKNRSSLRDVTVQRYLSQPRVVWNIARPFSSAVFSSRSNLQVHDLDEPATIPALDKVTIKVAHPRIEQGYGPSSIYSLGWGSIKIRGSHPVEFEEQMIGIVIIRDVINAVFEYFQVPLTNDEWDSVVKHYVPYVLDAQRKRLGSSLVYQHPGNPLRVDMLGDVTRFEGIQIVALKEKRLVFGLNMGSW